jgi:aryl-alcohol dehydrogenase-like predicted oxidoreductase
MAWAIAKGTVPIIGVTKASHIADAVKAAEITLTSQDIHDLEAAAKETGVVIKGEWEKAMH